MAERPVTARPALETAVSRERVSRRLARPAPLIPFSRVPAAILLLYLAVPLLALLWRGTSLATLRALGDPLVVSAIRLTLLTTGLVILLAVITGTPLAYWLARSDFRGKRLLETLIELPIALPPVIAGVALLMTFGRRGVFGPALEVFGIVLPFTTAAVVLAQLFVAVPFYVRGAALGFRAVPREVEEAAAVDGAEPWQTFRRITLPLAFPGLLSGLLLCGTRAAAEFGATLLFAGNLPGRTQTMTLAIMTAMETDVNRALALAVLLLLASLAILLGVRAMLGGRDELAMKG